MCGAPSNNVLVSLYHNRDLCSNVLLKSLAIMVSCLASFRSLFSQQDSRSRLPKHHYISDSRNVFLRGTRRTRPSKQTSPRTGLSDISGISNYHLAYVRAGDSDIDSGTANMGSIEHIPLNRVYIRRDDGLTNKPREVGQARSK